ncbi:MAG: hypothetical protein CSA22_01735 [Deltaproteobacteria bacterium]|nr:MAG: hypothetical protein CSA22_01735 [Deltaproteobacteria bacterium]
MSNTRVNLSRRARGVQSAVMMVFMAWVLAAAPAALADVSITATNSAATSPCAVETYTVSVTNPADDDMTEMVITVEVPDNTFAFVAGSATITTPQNGNLAGSDANPAISGNQLVWNLDDPALFNGNVAVAKNETLTLTFDVSYSCTSTGGAVLVTLGAERPRGQAMSETNTVNVDVYPGAVTIKNSPEIQDVTLESLPDNEEPTWQVTIENTGLGTIYNIVVRDVFGSGLAYIDGSAQIGSTPLTRSGDDWDLSQFSADPDGNGTGLADLDGDGEYDDLPQGETITITDVRATIVGCTDLTSSADIRYGCDDTASGVCYDSATAGETASASVAAQVVDPDISIAFDAAGKLDNISFCDGADDVTLAITNEPDGGLARYVSYKVDSFPAGWTVTDIKPAGVTWNSTEGQFENIPDIEGGETETITFDLIWEGPSGDPCNAAAASSALLMTIQYTNVCGTAFTPPTQNDTLSMESGLGRLTLEAAADIGTDRVNVGQTGISIDLTATVGNITGPNAGFSGNTNITYTLPPGWAVTNAAGGTVSGNINTGLVITWPHTFDSANSLFAETITVNATEDPCDAGSLVNMELDVDAMNPLDCKGCTYTLEETVTDSVFVNLDSATNDPLEDSSKTITYDNPLNSAAGEACRQAIYTVTYNFSANAPDTWANIVLTEELILDQTFAELVSVTYNSADYTSSVATSTSGTSVEFDLSGLEGSAPAPSAGHVLAVQFKTDSVSNSVGAGVQFSHLTLPGVPSDCSSDDDYEEGVPVSFGRQTMDIALSGPDLVGRCDVKTYRITLTKNDDYYAYDPVVTLNLDPDGDGERNYGYLPNSANLDGFTDEGGSPVTNFEPTVSGNTLVWDFSIQGGTGVDYESVDYIEVDLRLGCTAAAADGLEADVAYNTWCDNDVKPPVESDSATYAPDASYIIGPALTVYQTPEKYYAEAGTAAWDLYITNTGSGVAYNVVLQDELGGDLAYASSTCNGTNLAVETSGQTVTWRFQLTADPDGPGGLDDLDGDGFYDDLAPGKSAKVSAVFSIVENGCTEMTSTITGHSSCDVTAANPQTATWNGIEYCDDSTPDTAEAFVRSTQVVTANQFAGPMPLCGSQTASFILKNTGLATIYDVDVKQALPAGISFQNSSALYDLDLDGDGTYETQNQPLVDPPEGIGTAADPYIWDEGEISALAALAPKASVKIHFTVESTCGASGTSLNFASSADWETACGSGISSTAKIVRMELADMDVGVTTEVRNVTAGTPFTSNEFGADPGDMVEYRLTLTNQSDGTLTAENVRLACTLPENAITGTVTSANPTPTSTSPLYWDVGDLTSGATTQFTFQVQVDACVDDDLESVVTFGCNTPQCEAGSNTEAMTLHATPDVSTDGSITVTGANFTTAGGDVTIVIDNAGSTASNLNLSYTLPDGYVYDPSNGGATITSSLGVSYAGDDEPADPNADPLVFSGLNSHTLSNAETLTIQFHVKGDGSGWDTTAANDATDPLDIATIPDTVNHSAVFSFDNSCGDSDSATANETINPLNPDIDITLTEVKQVVGEGGTATWVLTLTNKGDAPASNIVLTNLIESGLTNATVTSGQAPDSGTTAANGTWTIPGPIPPGGTWTVTITAEVDTPPSGPLTHTATVEGFAKDAAGTTIGTYTHDEAKAYVVCFDMDKTVDKSTANVGELLTYDLTATFSNTETYQDVVLKDVLPAHMTYVGVTPQTDHTVADGGVTVSGQTLTWSPASFTGRQVFHMKVTARIDNDPANTGAPTQTTLTNTFEADFDVDFNGDIVEINPDNPDDKARVTADTLVTEPKLTLTKTMTPSLADAGDTITLTLTVANTGDGTAYNVDVSDYLNDTDGDGNVSSDPDDKVIFVLNSATAVTTPPGWTFADSGSAAENYAVTYTSNGGSEGYIQAGQTRTFVFTATLESSIVAGTTYTNTGRTDGHSLSDGDAEHDNPDFDRIPTDDGTADITVAAPGIQTKLLTKTSEDHTDPGDSNLAANPPLAIGEVVSVKLYFSFPEGYTENVLLRDRLHNLLTVPWGEYVPGSARLSKNSDDLTCANDPGGINSAATGTPVNVSVNTTADDTYAYIDLNLGTVTNANTATGVTESFTFTFDVVVRNVDVTNAGAQLVDEGLIRYTPDGGADIWVPTAPVTAHVAEPVLFVALDASPGAADGGETVTFTLRLENRASGVNGTDAFNLEFSDLLPADFTNPDNFTVVSNGGGRTLTPCTGGNYFNGNQLCGTIDQLGPGEYIDVTFTADLIDEAAYGKIITTEATLTGTSLPGEQGTGDATPGASGAENGERTGSGVNANDLSVSDPAVVSVSKPYISKKLVPENLWFAIGETASYVVTVPVPKGSATSFVVTDTLSAGLSFVPGTLSVVLPGGMTASTTPLTEGNAAFFTASGSDLTFDFGTLTASAADDIVITYDVNVDNVIENQDGDFLDNAVKLTYTDPSGGSFTVGPTVSVPRLRVGEPNLEVEKTITAGAVGSNGGDTVSWQVVVQNTGHTTAYQMNWSDVLPAGLYQISGQALSVIGDVFLNDTSTSLNTSHLAVSTTTNLEDTISLPLFQMAAGSEVTITFDAVIMNSVTGGETLTNATRVNYTSQPDGGRDNSTNPGNVDDDDDTDLNNYEEGDAASFTTGQNIAIDKMVLGDRDIPVGGLAVFRIRVSLDQGTTNALKVIDKLPDGLAYVSNTITPGTMGMVIQNTGYTTPTVSGQTVTFDFGDVTNPADGSADNDYLDIDLSVRVKNIPTNQQDVELKNGDDSQSSETWLEYGPTADTVYVDTDPGTPGHQGVSVAVVEPNLVITKTAAPVTPAVGATVTFTIRVEHTDSAADAFDVTVTDTLPAGLTYVMGSTTPPATADETDPTRPVFSLNTITQTEGFKEFSFQVTVDPGAASGQTLTNTARVDWSSITGADGTTDSGRNGDNCPGPTGLNDYCDTDTADVTPTMSAIIDATKTVAIAVDADADGEVDPGDTLAYTITLVNDGPAVNGVVFTDTIPEHTAYDPGSLTTTRGTADDSGNPDLSVSVGAMGTGETVTITFRVIVANGTPEGTVIRNQGSVDSDDTVPEPTDADGDDTNGDQPTDIPVGGTPAGADLYAWKIVELTTDADASGTITPGDTLRYWIQLQNTGDTELSGVSLSDTIPAGLTYVAGSEETSDPSSTLTITGDAVSLTNMTLPVGASGVIWFDVTVDGPPLYNTDADPDTETFVNQGTANSDQTDPVLTDANGDPSDGTQPTTFTAVDGSAAGSPEIDLQKRWSLSSDVNGNGVVNPGDSIAYTLTLTNTGSADAQNVRLSDPVPVNTTMVPGSVTTSCGVVIGENPVSVNVGTLAPGKVVNISFRVTVNSGTPGGTLIANQATATGDNFGDTKSDDNGDETDGRNPTLTPVEDPGTTGVTSPSALTKLLHATSESGSLAANVLIGEIVTYRVSVTLAKGTTRHATLSDTLPAGLSYRAGTARLAAVYDTALNLSENPGNINAAASGAFVNLTDGSDITRSGQTLSVFLGDVLNSDNDTNAETLTLEFQALVTNVNGNQAGESLTDTANLSYRDALNQDRNLIPQTHTVTVTEPMMAVSKTAAQAALMPSGGDITYTLVITNTAGAHSATGYDVMIEDTLDPAFTALTVDSMTPAGGVSGVTDTTAGTTLTVSAAVFPVGGTLTIVYTGTIPGPLTTGDTFANTARLNWTSLPGEQGTGDVTPGATGAADGERNGTGGVNDYADQDAVTVAVDTLVFEKSVNPTGTLPVGSTVTYTLVVTLPAWNVPINDSLITDVLDPGLDYVPGTLLVTPSGAAGEVTYSADPDFTVTEDSPAAGDETLTLNLGAVTNTAADIRTLTLTYAVRVANSLVNQSGHDLSNAATFTGQPEGGSLVTLTDATTVTVGEPLLTLTKEITSNTTDLEAGDRIDYRVTTGNTGVTTAYETVLTDTLPTSLTDVQVANVTVTGGGETPSVTPGMGGWTTSAFDLPPGGQVVITFSAALANTVMPGESLQNGVNARYTSLDGADANERDGSDPDPDQTDDSVLNNYGIDALSPVVIVADPVALDKRFYPDPSVTTYTIGETVRYRLTVTLVEGTVEDLVVTDILPDGLHFVSAVVSAGHTNLTHHYTAPVAVSGQELTFDFGTVVNPANGSDSDDVLVMDIETVVENIAANQDGVRLGNHAGMTFTDADGHPVTRDYDADTGTPGVQPLELELVEPVLVIEKTHNLEYQSLGDQVSVTLRVAHTAESRAHAYDLVITDTLPAGLRFVTGSASVPPVVSGTPATGETLTFTITDLSLAAHEMVITYQVRVSPGSVVGTPLVNSALLTWGSIPGATGDPTGGRTGGDCGETAPLNDYCTVDDAQVIPITTLFIEAVKTVEDVNGGRVMPGDELHYTVVLTNVHPRQDVTKVMYVDPLPVMADYVAGSMTLEGASLTDAADGDAGDYNVSLSHGLTIDVGIMESAQSVTIHYRLQVPMDTPVGVVIRNQGTVDSAETVPEPTDEDDNDANGDQPTEVVVGEDPVSNIRVEKRVALLDDIVAPTDGTLNVGDTVQYTILIRNTGDMPLTNVAFSDEMPAGVTVTGVSNASWSGGQTVTAAFAQIPVGGSETITITATLIAAGRLLNQGVVTTDETGSHETDGNSDTEDGDQPTVIRVEEPSVAGTPEIRLVKTDALVEDLDETGSVTVGDTLRYTLSVRNTGSAPATAVRVRDAIPVHTTLVAGSVFTSQGAVVTEDPMDVNVGTLAPGEEVIVTLRVTVDAGTPAGTRVSNQAVASTAETPDIPSDDPHTPETDDPTETPVVGMPELRIWKTANKAEVAPGKRLTYTLHYENLGPSNASRVVITDEVPGGTEFISSDTGVLVTDTTVRWELGTLIAGYSGAVSFTVRVDSSVPDGAEIVNSAYQMTTFQTEPVTGDPVTVPVNKPSPIRKRPDLSTSGKTVSDMNGCPLEPGDTLLYTVTLINTGNGMAPSVWYTDLPDALSILENGSVTTTKGKVNRGNSPGEPDIRINVGNLAPGETCTITYRVTVGENAPAGSLLSNQGMMDLGVCYPSFVTDNPLTIAKGDPTFIGPVGGSDGGMAPVSFEKRVIDPLDSYAPGDSVQLEVRVTHHGADTTEGMVIVDALPESLILVEESLSAVNGTAHAGPPIRFFVEPLAAGASAILTYTVMISESVVLNTEIFTQAQLYYGGTDCNRVESDNPDTSAELDAVRIFVGERTQGPDVRVTKTIQDLDAGLLLNGDRLRYRIQVTNAGDQPTSVLHLTDLLAEYLVLNPGSIETAGITIDPADTVITGTIAPLAPQADAWVAFTCRLDFAPGTPAGTGVVNQAEVMDSDGVRFESDDPSTAADLDPTVRLLDMAVPVLAPPYGTLRVVSENDYLVWEMTWRQPNPDWSMITHVRAELPEGVDWVTDSLEFDAGDAMYDPVTLRIRWAVNLAPDGQPATLRYRTRPRAGLTETATQASAWWDQNMNGKVDADERAQSPVLTDDPMTDTPLDPTRWTGCWDCSGGMKPF